MRGQLLAALAALPAQPWTPAQATVALATLVPIYNTALASFVIGTELTTAAVWIGELERAGGTPP